MPGPTMFGLTGQTEVGMIGTGSCLPETRVASRAVAQTLGVENSWIEERIGVFERRFTTPDEKNADLGASAAEAAIASAGVTPADLDAIIVATSTSDRPIPAVAARVQAAIGAHAAVAFDLNAACAGFVFATEVGRGLLEADRRRRYVLVIGTDTYSRVLNPTDRKTYPLFGDGAGAVVLGRVPASEGIFSTELCTDGRLAHYAVGGPHLPVTEDEGDHYLRMEGREVAALVRGEFPRLVEAAAKEKGVTVAEIDHLICHQANPRLIRECADAMDFVPEQVVVTGDWIGNTAAASIPIGLDVAARDGRIKPGDTILLITFGAGMSWGRTLMQWPSTAGGV